MMSPVSHDTPAPLPALRRRLARFRRDKRGTVSVESVIVLPLLMLWFVASFVFFDIYLTNSINEKAAYTVSDLLSRHRNSSRVNNAYIDGLNRVFDFLINNRGDTWIRTTSVKYDETDDKYGAEWSYATHGKPRLTDSDVEALRDRLPVMPGNETIILVETFTEYTPAFDVGIGPQTFRTFIFTRPRFVIEVLYEP